MSVGVIGAVRADIREIIGDVHAVTTCSSPYGVRNIGDHRRPVGGIGACRLAQCVETRERLSDSGSCAFALLQRLGDGIAIIRRYVRIVSASCSLTDRRGTRIEIAQRVDRRLETGREPGAPPRIPGVYCGRR